MLQERGGGGSFFLFLGCHIAQTDHMSVRAQHHILRK